MVRSPGISNIATRIASAIVLAPLAVAAAWYGGWPFAAFWAVTAVAVLWEWTALVTGTSTRMTPSQRAIWTAGGVLYAGLMLLAPLYLRADPEF